MQRVSQKWKDNQNELLTPESYVEVILALTDPDAYADATAEDNGAIYISNTEQTVSEVDKDIVPYATLEKNLWVLDGEMKIIPQSNYGDCGYIGNTLSDENCNFPITPIVTMNFSDVQRNLIAGVTITWGSAYYEYAVDFAITAYNGDTVVATKEVIGNADIKSVVNMDIVNYDRITISILKWCLPYRRARIAELLPGIEKTYSKTDLISFEHSQEVDIISASLPKSEISFSLDNTNDTFNPNNLDSLSKYLIERQEIKSRYGYKIGNKIEWINCGTFYMSEWDAPQSGISADFKARDLLEFMTGTYYGGVYAPNGISLYDLAVSVLQDAKLPLEDDGAVKWIIDDSLKNIYTNAPLPVDTHANCLQLIANAGMCVIYQDRRGILHIEPYVKTTTDYRINNFNSYSKSEISLSKPLRAVSVPFYTYKVADENSELYNGVVSVSGTQDVLITYSGTATNVVATVGDNATLNSATYYANVCKLNITANGDVSIYVKGKIIESSSVEITVQSGLSGETISVSNPLITSQSLAVSIGQWVESYMKNRMVLSSEWRADPRLDALDVVSNENDYNTNEVVMTSVKYSYNGGFKGSGDGRVI